MNDGDLVRQATAGQTAAYGELARRWSARVLAVCHARIARAAVAEELAQETLLRGFRALNTMDSPDSFGSWICGIAHRVCLDWRKSKRSKQIIMADPGTVALWRTADTSDHLAEDEERSRLLQEVENLPDDLREVLML
jgi:RNA polymerase sigma factor (sigma-70 family)